MQWISSQSANASSSGSATCEPEVNNGSLPESNSAPLPETEKPVVKKTKSRKKVEVKLSEQEVSRVILASDPTPEVAPKPARGRRKKTAEPAQDAPFAEGASNGSGQSTPTDFEMVAASAKPKRTRRVGEPKPKRYPVGEQEAEQGV